jgi:hypothetical protein
MSDICPQSDLDTCNAAEKSEKKPMWCAKQTENATRTKLREVSMLKEPGFSLMVKKNNDSKTMCQA